MRYEVERKFHVDDLAAVEERLRALGAEFCEEKVEEDTYFIHPSRDFNQTDEALRVRAVGEASRVTYKGPKIDLETKTRQEIDLRIPEGAETRGQWMAFFVALGFAPLEVVRKRRRKAFVQWEECRVEVSLDRIASLGEFVELELIADEAGLETTQNRIATLADRLGLTRNERRSYLQLLLEK
jgi:adenylate cyclase class 2